MPTPSPPCSRPAAAPGALRRLAGGRLHRLAALGGPAAGGGQRIRALVVAGEFSSTRPWPTPAEPGPDRLLHRRLRRGRPRLGAEARPEGQPLARRQSRGRRRPRAGPDAGGLAAASPRATAFSAPAAGAGHREAPAVSLGGRRLGVVGLGAIGEAVARRAEAFGLEVAWWGPREKPDAPWPRAESLLALARRATSWSSPAGPRGDPRPDRRGCIDALVPTACWSMSRAAMVSTRTALIAALQGRPPGHGGARCLRRRAHPGGAVGGRPQHVLTPHTAGATSAALPKMAALTRENLRRFFAGEPLANPVVE